MRLPDAVAEDDFVVRLWRRGDAEVLHAAVVDSTEHLRPWMDWISQEPLTVAERVSLIEEWERIWKAGGGVPMGVFLGETVVGGSGFVNPKPGSVEIAYWTHVRHLRQGHATRTARLMTSGAFSVPGITRVEIHHDRANVKSACVPRRLRFRRVGEQPALIRAPGQVGIDCTWAVDADEWAESLRLATRA